MTKKDICLLFGPKRSKNGKTSDPKTRQTSFSDRRRGGFILILVLVIVVLLALATYTFSELMIAERTAALQTGEQIQAKSLCESGVDLARSLLTQAEPLGDEGGIFDNPEQLRGVLVTDDTDSRFQGRFSVIASRLAEEGYLDGLRFGLENESARLNLSMLHQKDAPQAKKAREMLMALPGMTVDIADAILDWIDTDDVPRRFGAESEYYSQLNPPYAPKNGPLESVEDLLLVKDVTPQMLFGVDGNRNGVLDPHESSEALTVMAGTMDMSVALGWAAYLTVYSAEKNVNPDGQPRIFLNSKKLEELHDDLSELFDADTATFIVAYRQSEPPGQGNGARDGEQEGGGTGEEESESSETTTGETSGQTSGTAGGRSGGTATSTAVQATLSGGAAGAASSVDGREVDLSQPAKVESEQVLDLIDKTIQVTFKGQSQPTNIKSPFTSDPKEMEQFLPKLMGYCTVNSESTIPGRINVNQAPRVVLDTVPDLTEETIEEIIRRRILEPDETSSNYRYATWLWTEGIVNLEEMRKLLPYVTAGGDVYRGQFVGFFDGGFASDRVEVVIDATSTPYPSVLLWRNLKYLGRGFTLETLGAGSTNPN